MDLIVGVHLRSGGQGGSGARGGGRTSPELCSAAGFAGDGRSSAIGVRSGYGLVQKLKRNTCNSLGHRARVEDAQSMELGGGGGTMATEFAYTRHRASFLGSKGLASYCACAQNQNAARAGL